MSKFLVFATALLLPLAAVAAPFAYLPQAGTACINVRDLALPDDNSSCAITPAAAVQAIEALPSGLALYVALQGSNSLQRYLSPAAGTAATVADNSLPAITLAGQPLALAATPDSQTLWVAVSGSNNLVQVNLADHSTQTLDIGFKPGLLLVNALGTVLYVAEQDGQRLLAIDLTADPLTVPESTFTLSAPASSLALSGPGGRLFVSHASTGRLSVLGSALDSTISTLEVAGIGAVYAAGTSLYAATPGSVRVWDSATLVEGSALTVAGSVTALALGNDSTALYAATADGQLQALSLPSSSADIYPPSGRFLAPYRARITFQRDAVSALEDIGTLNTLRLLRLGDARVEGLVHVATFELGVSNDYAKAGVDFAALDTDYTFTSGMTSLTLPISLIDDSYFGNTEFFGLRLTLPEDSPFTSGTVEARVGIENDDSDPRERGGCSMGGGAADPLLPLLALGALAGLRLRRRHTR